MVDALKMKVHWLQGQPSSELDATLCRLEVYVRGKCISEFETENGRKQSHLDIPAYHLAEWLAENWWAILFEPRKSDVAADDPEFLGRHSFLGAEHGFPLPALSIVSTGKIIHLNALPREVPFAGIRFIRAAYAYPSREDVETVFCEFASHIAARLEKYGVKSTPFQNAWELVANTGSDEREFCEIVGALGLSPYDTHPEIEAAIDHLEEAMGVRALRDLALACTAQSFVSASRIAIQARKDLADSSELDLHPLYAVKLAPDNTKTAGYQRGLDAAERLRSHLSVSASDPNGSKKIFDVLKIDPSNWTSRAAKEDDLDYFSGIVALEDDTARLALLQNSALRRRFAAARAAYLAWVSDRGRKICRLMTNAVTRDQQASRAFAAELLAPMKYIGTRAQSGKLPYQRVFDLARELGVESDVVAKQAQNNGLVLTPA